MTGSIIQWNLRGHNANRPNLELLDSKYSPSVICLQETMLKDNNMTFKGFEPHHKPGTIDAMGRAHGGVSIYVKSNLPQSNIALNTHLQAIAIKITLPTTITICSLYLPSREPVSRSALDSLYQELPKPCL